MPSTTSDSPDHFLYSTSLVSLPIISIWFLFLISKSWSSLELFCSSLATVFPGNLIQVYVFLYYHIDDFQICIFSPDLSLCFVPCYILRRVTRYSCSININWINEWMFCFISQGSCRNQVKSGDKGNLPWNCHNTIHPAFLHYSKMIKAVGYERSWWGGGAYPWLSSKESACNAGDAEMWVGSLGQEDPLEEEMVTHSSILAWRIPWTEEPGGQQSMGSQKSQTQLSD